MYLVLPNKAVAYDYIAVQTDRQTDRHRCVCVFVCMHVCILTYMCINIPIS